MRKIDKMKKRNSGKMVIWLGAIMPLIAVIVAYLLAFNRQPPQFIIETPVVKVGEQIIIKAVNKRANRNESLNVEFDKHVFENAGEPFKYDNDNKQHWRFNIMAVDSTPEMKKLCAHQMRFGFKEEDLCKEEQAVSFQIHSSTTVETGTISIESLSAYDVKGFYKAPIDDEFGSKDIITLTIEEVDKNSRISTFKYILAGFEGMDSGTGSLNFTQKTIDIPGLGQGKVSLNRANKFILNFIYKGREVQFVQSNI